MTDLKGQNDLLVVAHNIRQRLGPDGNRTVGISLTPDEAKLAEHALEKLAGSQAIERREKGLQNGR